MSNISTQQIKDKVNLWITANGVKAITGPQMNEILTDLLDSLVHFDDDYAYLNLKTYSPTRTYQDGECCVFNFVVYQNVSGGQLQNQAPLANDPDPWLAITDLGSNFSEFEPYDNATEYELNDTVRYLNKLYLYINGTPSTGNTPPNVTYWREVSPSNQLFGRFWVTNTYYGRYAVVRHRDGLWQLNVDPGLLSVDFEAEAANGDWTPLPNVYTATAAQLTAAIAGNYVAPNRLYYVTDKRLFLMGLSQFRVANNGWYAARNADYQNVSGEMLVHDASGSLSAVWGNDSTYYWNAIMTDFPLSADRIGKMTIYGNRHYRNLTGNNHSSDTPDVDTTNWELVDLDDDSYQDEIDQVQVDSNFNIIHRKDKRLNEVGVNSLSIFQWGNNNVFGNKVEGLFYMLSNRTLIQGNIIGSGATVTAENFGNDGAHSGEMSFNIINGLTTIDLTGAFAINFNRNIFSGTNTVTLIDAQALIQGNYFCNGNYPWTSIAGALASNTFINFNFSVPLQTSGTISNSVFIGALDTKFPINYSGANDSIYEIADPPEAGAGTVAGVTLATYGHLTVDVNQPGTHVVDIIDTKRPGMMIKIKPFTGTTLTLDYTGAQMKDLTSGASGDSVVGASGHWIIGTLVANVFYIHVKNV